MRDLESSPQRLCARLVLSSPDGDSSRDPDARTEVIPSRVYTLARVLTSSRRALETEDATLSQDPSQVSKVTFTTYTTMRQLPPKTFLESYTCEASASIQSDSTLHCAASDFLVPF